MAQTSIYGLPYQTANDAPNGPLLGQQLAEAVEAELARIDAAMALIAGAGGISNQCGSGNTTSTSFVNVPSPSSFSFTKRQTSTRLVVHMHMSAFVTVSQPAAVDIGVLINGVDYQLGKLNFNQLSTHLQISGVRPNVAAGLAAGTYTVQARWRRASGSGTLNVDNNDWISILVQEVP